MKRGGKRGGRLAAGGLAVAIAVFAGEVAAICNVIPGTAQTFRATRGNINRPFARPGDLVELTLIPACDVVGNGFDADPSQAVVTVVFQPPHDAPRNIVVLTADCARIEAARQECTGQHNVASVTCVQVNGGGELPGIEVLDDTAGEQQRRVLRFRFPDTDALLSVAADSQTTNDDVTFTGPAAIAVTRVADALPCALANEECAVFQGEVIACTDRLFEPDGTCGTTTHSVFGHFTALPPPNDYQALCVDPSPPCTGLQNEVRFTVDRDGNVLLPIDWRGVLLGVGVPVARLLRGTTALEAFAGGSDPIRLPSNAFLASYTLDGLRLPPIFEPQSDPTSTDALTLFGTADAPENVLRIARRGPDLEVCSAGERPGLPCATAADCPGGTCATATCRDGTEAGNACSHDGECPGGECGTALFDFSTRFDSLVGPVRVPRFGAGLCQAGERSGGRCEIDDDCPNSRCVTYRLEAKDPVPLDGIVESQGIFAPVASEGIEGRFLNADSDATDEVVLLFDRATGVLRPMGSDARPGRATARIHTGPFSVPAVMAERDILAFLEPESLEGDCLPAGNCDRNADGDVADGILRVFRLHAGGQEEITAPHTLAVDADPQINHRSIFVSGPRVFFRRTERGGCRQGNTSIAGDTNFEHLPHGAFSADGRFIVFDTIQTRPDCTPQPCSEIFVRDRDSDGDGIFDEPDAGAVEPMSVSSTGDLANAPSWHASISGDGRFVAFTSGATNLVPGTGTPCDNGPADFFVLDGRFCSSSEYRRLGQCANVFVHDRDSDRDGVFDEPGAITTTVVSVASDGSLGNHHSFSPVLSGDGRFVAFTSSASNLVAGDDGCTAPTPNVCQHVFLHDRDADGDGIFDEAAGGGTVRVSVAEYNSGPSISVDGRYVAFEAQVDLLPESVFVYDRISRTTTSTSVNGRGEAANGLSFKPAISADGQHVAFISDAANLFPGAKLLNLYAYLRDATYGETTALGIQAVAAASLSCMGCSDYGPSISHDGRYVVFTTRQGLGFCSDGYVFLHDRVTDITVPLNYERPTFAEGTFISRPAISGDGGFVAFQEISSPPVSGPVVGSYLFDVDLVVRGCDPNDTANDVSGNGRLSETVLQVLDTGSRQIETLCPAGAVSIAEGRAAFLRPEAAGEAVGCPTGPSHAGGSILNDDEDASDEVVHVWQAGSPVENLHCAATAIALSPTHLVALVPEAGQGEGSLNADGDVDDTVVKVYRLDDSVPTSCSQWTAAGPASGIAAAADTTGISGPIVAMITPEAAEGMDLNSDGDRDDRVLQLFYAESGELRNVGQAAEEFVLGEHLVAFRTRETSQGQGPLNGDGDVDDDVLQVYDLEQRRLVNTGAAVTPCFLEACDPRVPYRVVGDTIRFLTYESEQGQDLNGNRTVEDLVLQTFNLRLAERLLDVAGSAAGVGGQPMAPRASVTTMAAIATGICTGSGQPCAARDDCGTGNVCFVPPGGCIRALERTCNPSQPATCGDGAFCKPSASNPVEGTCHEVIVQDGKVVPCASNAECPAFTAVCDDVGTTSQRVGNPLALPAGGGVAFLSALGHCSDRPDLRCRHDADCGNGSCQRTIVAAAAADSDRDEIADPFDNCSRVANISQRDDDGDGVGDACERDRPLPCAGDCNGDDQVTVDELVRGVRIALEVAELAVCPAFETRDDDRVTVDELITAVARALGGCGVGP